MNKAQVLEAIRACGIVAVVRAESSQEAMAVTRALVRGGVRGIEITFTVPDAPAVISVVAREIAVGNLVSEDGAVLLGGGTVTTREQAISALDAGAQFLVSPCTVPDVLQVARERGVACLPGAMTPTEIWNAYALGGDIIKVFPASRFGPAYFKDLRAPLPQIPLLPTGGVEAANAAEWLQAGAVALGVGGKLVDKAAIKAGDWDTITERARELVCIVRETRGQ
jgi:2-dehydro-3-deoxyphosphogluconate aldolase/(4S)-4-hydroxy-2-oxoglutarate aldolase